jgi:hypothetical protein
LTDWRNLLFLPRRGTRPPDGCHHGKFRKDKFRKDLKIPRVEGVDALNAIRQHRQRLNALIECEKAGTLSPEEKAEVDHFMELEHILRMANARARQIVSRGE